jgi:pimeloyl-ACP methyl ester carboxylesterase
MNIVKNRHQFAKGAGALLFATVLSACTTVRIAGPNSPSGTRVAYYKAGAGSPTVVFESGLGDGKAVWTDVVRAVKRTNQVFSYDRPGYGASSRVEGPRDPCTIATEEHNLLHAVGLTPPYILVGHSIGGLYQYVYAKLYPEDVAGVVLVDPTHPGYLQTIQHEASRAATVAQTMLAVPVLFSDTEKREWYDMDGCLAQIDTTKPLNVPAHVLVASKFGPITSGEFKAMYFKLSNDWGRLAGVEVERISAAHYIQSERPHTVIDAIASVSSMAREQRAKP